MFSLGPFSVGEQIGEGAMGAVYRGVHEDTGVASAIKVIRQISDRRARRLLHDEVRAHAGLRHRGIVDLFDYGQVGQYLADVIDDDLGAGIQYVAMEFADRGTIRNLMPVSDYGRARQIVVQILEGLAYAHAQGVVHRDLKPENLLLFNAAMGTKNEFVIKLTDFGVAHALDRQWTRESGPSRFVAGTPRYMAPEQFVGRWREFGPWTDLYSLGCLAWELVCGRPPFVEQDTAEMARRHVTARRPPLEPEFSVPDGLQRWIHQLMAIHPRHRFRRAADALWMLPDANDTEGSDVRTLKLEPVAVDAEESHQKVNSMTLVERIRAGHLDGDAERDDSPTVVDSQPLGWSDELEIVDGPLDEPENAGGEIDEIQLDLHPPIPSQWRRLQLAPYSLPLLGTGLGLFGLRQPPFVNRDAEGDHIWEALGQVVDETITRTVLISGGSGTGKSRLAEWMAARAHEVGAATIIRAVHTPSGRGLTEGVRGALQRLFRLHDLPRGQMFERLREKLTQLGGPDCEDIAERDARALTEYLRPTLDDSSEIDGPRYSFTSVREHEALLERVLAMVARRRPIVLWLDDLQWGSKTLGFVEYLQSSDSPPPVLVLATVRSDVVASRPRLRRRLDELTTFDAVSEVEVQPLTKEYQRQLIEGLLPMSAQTIDELVDRTEGHPLFAMQLLNHWIENGDIEASSSGFEIRDREQLALPGDIHQLWMERLERLLEEVPKSRREEMLEALEVAAILGREVVDGEWRGVLEHAQIEHDDDLVERLVERGLAWKTDQGWSFAHGLFAESIRRHARQRGRFRNHHRRCARELSKRKRADEPGLGERVADHWIEAGEFERALEPLRDEIRFNHRQGRDPESRRLLSRRKQLLDELDVPADHPRRIEQWLEESKLLSNSDLARAKELGAKSWERSNSTNVSVRSEIAERLVNIELSLGNRQAARGWARKGLVLARRARDSALEGRLYRRIAWICYFEGELEKGHEHAERALEIVEEAGNLYGRIEVLRLLANFRRALGKPGAEEVLEEACAESTDAGFTMLEAQLLGDLGEFRRYAGDVEQARYYYLRYAERLKGLSRPETLAVAKLNLAQVEVWAGNFEQAREHLLAGEELLESVGTPSLYAGIRHLVRLTLASGRGERLEFEQHWREIADGWPSGWSLFDDHPWLLEIALAHTEVAHWDDVTPRVRTLAEQLWERLGDDEAARRIAQR